MTCSFSLKDNKKNTDVRELLGLEPVSLVIRRDRLWWFGRVECKHDADLVKRCMLMETEAGILIVGIGARQLVN